MKKLLLILSLFAFFSCGNSTPLDKSIIEDLTIKEVSDASKDSLFSPAYEAISRFKISNKDNKLVLAKYLELTWQDYISFTGEIPNKLQFVYDNMGDLEERYLKYSTPILKKGQKLMDSYVKEFKAGRMNDDNWSKKYHTEKYIKGESKNYHLERIIEEFIDPDFVDMWGYQDVILDSIRNLKNPLANDLYNNLSDIYKQLSEEKK